MSINAQKVTMAVAVRYLDAARTIVKHTPTPNALWEPLNHLFAMSAELALKTFLERQDVPLNELKKLKNRHSLNALLLLAVRLGLRTTARVAQVIGQMDKAHSLHHYRYVPRPRESEAILVSSPYTGVALTAVQQLIDQCSTDRIEVRKCSIYPDDWPPAALPVRALSTIELEHLIEQGEQS